MKPIGRVSNRLMITVYKPRCESGVSTCTSHAVCGIWKHVEHLLLITYRGKYRPDVLGMAPHQLRLKTDASLSLFIRLEWDLVQHNLACETIANSLRIA